MSLLKGDLPDHPVLVYTVSNIFLSFLSFTVFTILYTILIIFWNYIRYLPTQWLSTLDSMFQEATFSLP